MAAAQRVLPGVGMHHHQPQAPTVVMQHVGMAGPGGGVPMQYVAQGPPPGFMPAFLQQQPQYGPPPMAVMYSGQPMQYVQPVQYQMPPPR